MKDKDNSCPRILLVEDDADQRMLVSEALSIHYGEENSGNIVAVASAEECLAQDLSAFDIVLQDYHLPDMSGQDLLAAILARVDIPVIFVTGENDSGTAAEAIKRGAQDYVVKLGDYIFALPVVIDKNISQHRIKKDNKRLHRELHQQLEHHRSRITGFKQVITESVQVIERTGTEEAELTEELAGFADRIPAAAAKVSELNQRLTEHRKEAETLDNQLHELQMTCRELEVRCDAVRQRATETLGLDVVEAYRDYQHDDQTDWEAVRTEIAEIQQKIDRLGNVNLDAIAEQKELEGRENNLAEQVADIDRARGELEQLILKLNDESRCRFEQKIGRAHV